MENESLFKVAEICKKCGCERDKQRFIHVPEFGDGCGSVSGHYCTCICHKENQKGK